MFKINVFSNRLKMLRLTRGTTRSHMSQITGITVSSIGNYERGDKIPGADSLKLLCDYYQVSADYLLGRTDAEQNVSQWPAAVPVGAAPSVNSIKHSVDSMISSVCLSAHGLYTLECYSEIFELLTEIDSFASKKLFELQLDYPGFRQFGSETQILFDGIPLLMALSNGDENAKKFAQRLTSTISEIKNEIVRIEDRIKNILIFKVFEAIQGRPIENTMRHGIQPARGDNGSEQELTPEN